MNKKIKGYTLIEILFSLLIFIFVALGIAKGFLDFQKDKRSLQILNTGRLILEEIRSSLELKPPSYFKNLDFFQENATCFFNGTCSFELEDCYINPKYKETNCLPGFNCTYCLIGNNLLSVNGNCSRGQTYNLAFNVSKIIDPETGNPIAFGTCLRVYFSLPWREGVKEYRTIIIRPYGEIER